MHYLGQILEMPMEGQLQLEVWLISECTKMVHKCREYYINNIIEHEDCIF